MCIPEDLLLGGRVDAGLYSLLSQLVDPVVTHHPQDGIVGPEQRTYSTSMVLTDKFVKYFTLLSSFHRPCS
jgi:hypothetical protein